MMIFSSSPVEILYGGTEYRYVNADKYVKYTATEEDKSNLVFWDIID